MTKKILDAIDAMTAKIFAYQPDDKGQWAKTAKPRKPKKKKDDRHSSI